MIPDHILTVLFLLLLLLLLLPVQIPAADPLHLLLPRSPCVVIFLGCSKQMDPGRSPAPPSSASLTSFPILAITILGILTTAVLLVSYYVFVINCRVQWRRPDLLRRILSATLSSRRGRGGILYIPPVVHIATAEFRGLEPAAIRALPVVRFSAAGDGEEEAAAASATSSSRECAVCLSEFQEGESLKLLPGCCHAFHIDCIDTWLQFNANCPLCRSVITSTMPQLTDRIVVLAPRRENDGGVVIEVRDEQGGQSSMAGESPISPAHKKNKKSMGDECIGLRAAKDDQFVVQPIRRSFSMDSSNDRQLYLSLQEMLRNRQHGLQLDINERSGQESSNGAGGASGRLRRSFFSFGRSSRSAVLPVQMDV